MADVQINYACLILKVLIQMCLLSIINIKCALAFYQYSKT